MSVIIAAEHFELTPAIEAKVDECTARIDEIIGADGVVRVFLSKTGHHEFTALFKTHVDGLDLVSSDRSDDLYGAIAHAAARLRKQIVARHGRRNDLRRTAV